MVFIKKEKSKWRDPAVFSGYFFLVWLYAGTTVPFGGGTH